ncbi:hypothetical protein J5X98_24980 [Leptothermofonsia sichuanensis E412]|uniref:ATP-binding protein n=1 Tax=Leptothermofonsia sichuanensis TaxID=2917832 RepID=UPI001CA74EC8|nr:ATP-binding protein [Leptothermofonsia sichuanensis]QZZ20455.1 hypothetical protein J5X98_24980 [Leptothermofonsia sichuanensis E412]
MGLLLLLVAGYVGNLTRWTLFFDIDFIFGSIAVWIVVCLYGVRWGTLAGFIAASCTYFLWKHPYTIITFTCETLFVGWCFHRYRQNLVLLNGIFWLLIGMPLIWLFYAQILKIDPVQAQIILLKQPVNGIFNALIAILLITYLPVHRWLDRPRAITTLSFQQTLFNLLVAFVFLPSLLLIILASRGVVEGIRTTAQIELSRSTAYVLVEVRSWYQQRFHVANEMAHLVANGSLEQIDHWQQHITLAQEMLPDVVGLAILNANGRSIVSSPGGGKGAIAHPANQPYLETARHTLNPTVSNLINRDGKKSPSIFLNVPIAQNENFLGFVVCELELDLIHGLLTTNAEDQNVVMTLVGRDHSVIFSTQADRTPGQSLNLPQEGELYPLSRQAYQWFPTKGSRLMMVRWMNSFFVQETPVVPGLPWTLIVEDSAAPSVRHIQSIFMRNLAIVLAIAGLALIFSVLLSRQLVRPLSQLALATTNVPNKLLSGEPIDWPESLVTEVAFLVRNFKMMTATLSQKFTEVQQALDYNALLKRITEKVRDSLDEGQILQTAVQELATVLDVECCNTDVYNLEQQTCLIRCEHTNTLPPIQGLVIPISSLPEVYHQLIQGLSFQFCMTIPNPARPHCKPTAILACPILDDQGALGDLWVFKNREEVFYDQEIRLVQQVANQCAIAIRQARLYQTAQIQLKALEELNNLKDDFLSTVSHELRTPISNMKMAIEMLKLTAGEERRDRYLKILQTECDREADLINDLLDLQRLTAGTQALNLEPIHLQEWVAQITESFQERTRSRQQVLQIEVAPEVPVIMSDPACLDRILNELLNNACKYTPPGERIKVSARTVNSMSPLTEAPDLSFIPYPSSFIILDVCNSGVEIPASELAHIFEKFYRVPGIDRWKQGGTGLGLTLVQKMTEHLGGKIYVESSANQTCFTVELPVRVVVS